MHSKGSDADYYYYFYYHYFGVVVVVLVVVGGVFYRNLTNIYLSVLLLFLPTEHIR